MTPWRLIPRAVEAHHKIVKAPLDPSWLTLEQRRFTQEPWVHHRAVAHPVAMEDHPGATKVYPGAMEARPRAMKTHSGAIEAHHRAVEAHSETLKARPP
jgi:hypothetical protein